MCQLQGWQLQQARRDDDPLLSCTGSESVNYSFANAYPICPAGTYGTGTGITVCSNMTCAPGSYSWD